MLDVPVVKGKTTPSVKLVHQGNTTPQYLIEYLKQDRQHECELMLTVTLRQPAVRICPHPCLYMYSCGLVPQRRMRCPL